MAAKKSAFEAAENARVLHGVAKAAAAISSYGPAVALEVLALEEAAKAQALRMCWRLSLVGEAFVDPDRLGERLEDVLQRDHIERHRFAAWHQGISDLLRQAGATDEARRLSHDRKHLPKYEWLYRAERLKQRGLYVDPHAGTSPSDVTRADYRDATAMVEPYVTATVRAAEQWRAFDEGARAAERTGKTSTPPRN